MQKKKTYEEINEKIKKGKAVVLTASEVSEMSRTLSPSEILKKVDVVTTATFGPMCSSGMFVNIGHTSPPMRMEQVWMNDVPVYGGIAAVDVYIGATSESETQPAYGGGHLIEDLIAGNEVKLRCQGKGTDCYPRKTWSATISRDTVKEMTLLNPRNAYQNYAAAVNGSDKTLFTYMGMLLPRYGNMTYSTSGEMSPLLNDPWLRTIGMGTRIFLGGASGYVTGKGTQFNTSLERNDYGIPVKNAATIAVSGNAREMSRKYIRAAWFEKYGVSLFVGIGIPVPVLDEDMAARVSIRNEQIHTTIVDYGTSSREELGRVNYEQLQSGYVKLRGKKVRTAPMSSLPVAKEISEVLAARIRKGEFQLTEPLELLK